MEKEKPTGCKDGPAISVFAEADPMKALRTLLLGDPAPLAEWLGHPRGSRLAALAATAAAGLAAYGFTTGYWRSPMMAAFVAVKMPLLIALVLACNGLLNGLFGLLLGSGLGFRQTWLALLMSFSIAAVLLGALAPVLFFLAWNAPPPGSPQASSAHSAYLLAHTFVIGYAGVVANVHLYRLLAHCAPSRRIASVTLCAWLAGNAFVGAQFSWILRPFFGHPSLQVAFLRPDFLRGTFYQSVWASTVRLTGDSPVLAGLVLSAALLAFGIPVLAALLQSSNQTHAHEPAS